MFLVSNTFLTNELKLDGLEIGVMLMIAFVGSLPGTFLGGWVSRKTNPRMSWTLNLFCWCAVTLSGSFALA